MGKEKESRWPFGACVIICVVFAIAGSLKGDWLMVALFGLFGFLNVSQYFKPVPKKPYEAEFCEDDLNV